MSADKLPSCAAAACFTTPFSGPAGGSTIYLFVRHATFFDYVAYRHYLLPPIGPRPANPAAPIAIIPTPSITTAAL